VISNLAGGKSRRLARQAARWHAEMEEPSSHVQVEEFETWLKADPAHLTAYRDTQAVAEAGTRLRSTRQSTAPTPVMARAYRPAFAIAATVAFAIGLWALVRVPAPAYAAVFNRGQATRVVALRDGSIVTLDTATALDVEVAPTAHHVKMASGRARFAVRPSSDGPLMVTASAGEIMSANGVFDVAVADDDVRVWVISGTVSVALRAANEPVAPLTVASGHGVRLEAGTRATPIERPDTAWPVAHIAFDQKPLVDILAIANRTGQPDIVVADDATGRLRVTGVMDLRDTRKLARKLAAALDLTLTDRNGSLQLSR
jgi:transmembrane sensor